MFRQFFSISVFSVLLRQMTPVLLSALGCMFCYRAGTFNMGMEGYMLFSAFASISVNALTQSWVLGLLAGMAISILFALLHAFFVHKYKAHTIIVGFAINTLASALTIFLLQALYGSSGSYIPDTVDPIPTLTLPFLKSVPVLDGLLNGHSVVFWLAILLTIAAHITFKKTPYGMHIIAVGENCQAARSVGINDAAILYSTFVICGALSGIAGAFFSTGATKIFVRDMIAGLGFISIAVMNLGNGKPIGILFASLLYGASKTLSLQVQTLPNMTVPSQFIEMIPYVLTVIMLIVYALVEMRRKKAAS